MPEDSKLDKKLPVCWASCIGGCGDSSSREHLVSKSLFNTPKVSVQGFHWCKNEAKEIGIEGITAKILCREHNSELSQLDIAGGLAFEAFRQNAKRNGQAKRRSLLSMINDEVLTIDALLLERWLLKTLLNLTFEGKFLIGATGSLAGVPPRDLVEVCYGINKFSGSAGMYVAASPGMTIKTDESIKFSPVIKDGTRVIAGLFMFQGIRMFLWLIPEALPSPRLNVDGLDGDWANANLLRPFMEIKFQHSALLSQPIIRFKW